MMPSSPRPPSATRRPLADVAETARWVAAYRAWESARPDALFHDPFAARFAGTRGEEIARTMPQPGAGGNGWPIVTRTVLIDEMVLAAVAEGCTAVLNLGAGYDTRPYRLPLPADLAWIEVDQADLLAEKARVLEGERPRCALRRLPADLADPGARAAILDSVAAEHARVLVLTEGVLVYLEAEAVADLARALHARPSLTGWITDLASPAMVRRLRRGREHDLAEAPLRFGPSNGVGFLEALGWRMREARSFLHEGARLRRVPWPLRPFAWVPPPDPRAPGRAQWAAVVRLEREP